MWFIYLRSLSSQSYHLIVIILLYADLVLIKNLPWRQSHDFLLISPALQWAEHGKILCAYERLTSLLLFITLWTFLDCRQFWTQQDTLFNRLLGFLYEIIRAVYGAMEVIICLSSRVVFIYCYLSQNDIKLFHLLFEFFIFFYLSLVPWTLLSYCI